MTNRRCRLLTISVVALALPIVAHAQSPARDPIAGRWRGESICLARPGICHDEIVVYHFTHVPGDSTRYELTANKIVRGAEEEMGRLPCVWTPRAATLRCDMPQGTWRFTARADSLVGGLTLTDGTAMRRVRVRRG